MAVSARKQAVPLLDEALKRVSALPRVRQDAIAAQIIETLDSQSDKAAIRFHQLIEQKYTIGLNAAEVAELDRLEAGFQRQDEKFYAPILERITASLAR